MDTYFQRTGLQDYVFGKEAPSANKNGHVVESGSSHVVDIFASNAPEEPAAAAAAARLASVALPRLAKGAVQHEMIVAYLYQQQRQRFWISDDLSTDEGAFMRETWNDFITAPAPLSQSLLAEALVDLNAEVCSWQLNVSTELFAKSNRL